MIPLLTHPFALLVALSIPALVAIYFFRNRFRRRHVAGLFLWDSALRAREGGTVIRRMRASWLFLLELLALLALTLAAADPRLPFEGAPRALLVVLDDSASMSAGAPDTCARDRGLALIARTLRRERFRSVRFILAGAQPVLADVEHGTAGLADAWRCQSPHADMDGALALATQLAADQARILVVSDRGPVATPAPGQMRWEAVGQRAPNLAFVEARRSTHEGHDRLFVALGNFTAAARTIDVTLETERGPLPPVRMELPAGGTAEAALSLPPNTGVVRARLPPDALAIDNRIALLPDPPRRVGVRVALADAALRRCFEEAVAATGLADDARPTELLITDQPDAAAAGDAWVLRVSSPTGAVAFAGPFVVDRDQPLGEGLTFHGAIWGADPALALPGSPVILAGNVPLLTAQILASGKCVFDLQLAPALSNVQNTPAWPALAWNTVSWRAATLPGVVDVNVHAGADVAVAVPGGVSEATCTGPTGAQTLRVRGRRAVLAVPVPGVYALAAGDWRCAVAANFCAGLESDLRPQCTGSWGDWHAPAVLTRDYASWAWLAACLALAALIAHTVLVARRPLAETAAAE